MYTITTSHTEVTSNPSVISGRVVGGHAGFRAEFIRILWHGLSCMVKYRRKGPDLGLNWSWKWLLTWNAIHCKSCGTLCKSWSHNQHGTRLKTSDRDRTPGFVANASFLISWSKEEIWRGAKRMERERKPQRHNYRLNLGSSTPWIQTAQTEVLPEPKLPWLV